MEKDFIECRSCESKPGYPTLCDSCISNRDLISSLKSKLCAAVDAKDQAMRFVSRLIKFINEMKELSESGDDLDCMTDEYNALVSEFSKSETALEIKGRKRPWN